MGLDGLRIAAESATASCTAPTRIALTRELRSHGIRVLGSTIVGLEHHTPENIAARSSTRLRTIPIATSSCSTRRCRARRCTRRWHAQGALLEDVDLADIHGQHKFNFRHPHIGRDESKSWLDFAFRHDYEVNGPSLYRMMRTMYGGWKRYAQDADERVRARVSMEARSLKRGHGAALWAMEQYLRASNQAVSGRIASLRKQIENEFGLLSRVIDATVGPLLLWSARREASIYPHGRPLEPRTFVERRNWR